MDYRPIAEADLEACTEVLYVADDELSLRRGLPIGPRNPQALLRLFRHLREVSPERSWLAEERGRIVGFGSAIGYAEMTFLGFLFVRPELQARGTGRELLERAMAGSTYRGVCIGSIQPISAALYARYGMVPRVPLYIFLGRPNRPLPGLPAGVSSGDVESEALTELDREVIALERPADHALWAADRQRVGLYTADQLVGYGYVQRSGRIGPVVVRRRELLLPLLGELMKTLTPADGWQVNVPGSAAETFVALLHAGMRLDGPPIIYCSTELRTDHSRYLPASFALP